MTRTAQLAGDRGQAGSPGGVLPAHGSTLHGLGTHQHRRVWISLPRGVHTPVLQFPSLEVIHVQPALHRLQVATLRSGPIRLKVYGVEKTLVDCFRHRHRLGMEQVLEALKDVISQRQLNVDELWRQAQAQRMQRVMNRCGRE